MRSVRRFFMGFLHGASCPTSKSLAVSLALYTPVLENISLCPSGKSSLDVRAVPPDQEGRFAVVTKRWAGCGGRGLAGKTNGGRADGEIVWSWLLDAEAWRW